MWLEMGISGAMWWQDGIIYEVYPRSFFDTNGDGIGDLPGITERLDYLERLGVDALWLSPVYPSPMADFGYDVADYCNIDPLFGSLADFDALLAAVHARGMRLILDFVPNHTSEQHPWFLASRSSRSDPKRDWYLWRDAAPDGGPPNNWQSQFGGSAWEWDAATGQYYLHSFLKEQPDLNWRNGDVREAMYDALRFWLDRGVDGFRVDVLWLLIKDDLFRDNPVNPAWHPGQSTYDRFVPLYTSDRPEVQAIVAAMRSVLDAYTGPRAHRGDLSAHQAARRLLRTGSSRSAAAVQLRLDSEPLGTPQQSQISYATIRAPYRRVPGRTGCSEITTSRESRRASERPKPASRH